MSNSAAPGATSWAALFRLSLRELLMLIAMVALAIASMKYASPAWRTCVYAITMAIFMWAAVIAVVDRGSRQAFAIGMVILMVIYGVLVVNGAAGRSQGGNREMNPSSGRLPTTRIVKYLFPITESVQWFDRRTDQLLPNFDPAKAQPGAAGYVQRISSPEPANLMPISHCWWALLLGYIGGRFARVVYLRRNDLSRAPS
jgi:predicted PurR-regulated permease PerM